ncbi:hypothetical protein FHU41_002560 [Psychromicrobium silvestre]|uniref:Uncharacterized protein n=1 Tax=Psychromicrobium silvestre TaxID=1645614 RepID=A0A7Y9LVD1_9MICC|nr:hypothetical protein [Psychromicrobium silvestre]
MGSDPEALTRGDLQKTSNRLPVFSSAEGPFDARLAVDRCCGTRELKVGGSVGGYRVISYLLITCYSVSKFLDD